MKFKTVAEAFNYYKNFDNAALEKRAQEIGKLIDTDPDADVESLNIELRGIKEAKANNADNMDLQGAETRSGMKIVSGMNTAAPEEKVFGDDVADTPEYRSAFFKSLLGRKLNTAETNAMNKAMEIFEKRSSTYSTSTNTAAVLPTQTLNEVVKKARTMGGLLSECRSFSLPSNIAIPVGTPATKATWHTEGAAVETDNPAITSVTFGGYEIIKIFSISAKVKTMSIDAFESYLVQELTDCVMECIADAIVNGTGTNQGTGISTITWTKNTNWIEAAKNTGITYANVISTIALLSRGYSTGAKWTMNNATLYKAFYGLCDENKRPIFIADPQGDGIGKILGHEVVIDDNIDDDVVYLGDFSRYMGYNMPDGIVIEASRESSFKSGLIDYRAMAIADCKPIVGEAFVKLTVAAS